MTREEVRALIAPLSDSDRAAVVEFINRDAAAVKIDARHTGLPAYVLVMPRGHKTGRPVEVCRKKAAELLAAGSHRLAGGCE
jgi:hypothetical protein